MQCLIKHAPTTDMSYSPNVSIKTVASAVSYIPGFQPQMPGAVNK